MCFATDFYISVIFHDVKEVSLMFGSALEIQKILGLDRKYLFLSV